MIKTVSLKKEDCYCDLATFYENVARKISARTTEKPNLIAEKFALQKMFKKCYGLIIVRRRTKLTSR